MLAVVPDMRERIQPVGPVLSRCVAAVVLCLGAVFGACAQPGPADARRPAVLDQFDGDWAGTFRVYTYDGTLVDSLVAEHRYHWEGAVQHGTFTDRYPDGRVVRATARNYVEDGVLYCEVEKDNGERTVHRGRVQDGAVIWYRQTEEGLTESFRERVVPTPGGPEYQIDGFGVYPSEDGGSAKLLFVGRYQAVSSGPE